SVSLDGFAAARDGRPDVGGERFVAGRAAWAAAFAGFFADADAFRLAMAGISPTTSAAGLSSPTPLDAACRTRSSPVQPRNSASITTLGSTQWVSRRRSVAGIRSNGGLGRSSGCRRLYSSAAILRV